MLKNTILLLLAFSIFSFQQIKAQVPSTQEIKMKTPKSSLESCDCSQRLQELSYYYSSQEEYEKSLNVYRKALDFSKVTKPYDYYHMATLLAGDGECILAREYLKTAILKGHDLTYIPYDKNLPNCLATNGKEWEEFLENAQVEHKNNVTNLDIEYLKALHDIRGSDQTIRRLIEVPEETYAKLDSINFYRLKELIDEKGFPDYQKHGFEGSQIVIVLVHATRYGEKMYSEVMAILKSASDEGNIRSYAIAQMMDERMRDGPKGKQLLGTRNIYRAEKFEPIAQPEIVDSLRFEYNLLRLNEQAIQEKRKLPEGYRPFSYPKDYFCGYEF